MVLKSFLSLLAVSATTVVVSAHNTPVGTLKFDFHQIAFGTRKLSKDAQCKREEAAQGLFESLCKGLDGEKSRILTFTDDEKIQKCNRDLSGCANDPCKDKGKDFACVQFPFASTIEAGAKSCFTCVPPLTQYFQGAILKSFRTQTNIVSGQTYELEICNFDCKTLKPAPFNHRRAPVPETLQQGRLETFPPFTSNDQGLSTGIIGLDEALEPGVYSLKTTDNHASVSSGHARRAPGDDIGSLGQGQIAVVNQDGGTLASARIGGPGATVQHSRDLSIRNDLWYHQRTFTLNFTLHEKTFGLSHLLGTDHDFLDVTTTLTRLS